MYRRQTRSALLEESKENELAAAPGTVNTDIIMRLLDLLEDNKMILEKLEEQAKLLKGIEKRVNEYLIPANSTLPVEEGSLQPLVRKRAKTETSQHVKHLSSAPEIHFSYKEVRKFFQSEEVKRTMYAKLQSVFNVSCPYLLCVRWGGSRYMWPCKVVINFRGVPKATLALYPGRSLEKDNLDYVLLQFFGVPSSEQFLFTKAVWTNNPKIVIPFETYKQPKPSAMSAKLAAAFQSANEYYAIVQEDPGHPCSVANSLPMTVVDGTKSVI